MTQYALARLHTVSMSTFHRIKSNISGEQKTEWSRQGWIAVSVVPLPPPTDAVPACLSTEEATVLARSMARRFATTSTDHSVDAIHTSLVNLFKYHEGVVPAPRTIYVYRQSGVAENDAHVLNVLTPVVLRKRRSSSSSSASMKRQRGEQRGDSEGRARSDSSSSSSRKKHLYIHTYIYTYIHLYIHKYIHLYIHTYIYTYIYYTYIHTYTFLHAYTFIHTYIHHIHT